MPWAFILGYKCEQFPENQEGGSGETCLSFDSLQALVSYCAEFLFF
jgi:hypothetical protein